MTGYVVCMNDDIKLIIINDEVKAKCTLERMAYDHWFGNQNYNYLSYQQYRAEINWNIQSAGVIK